MNIVKCVNGHFFDTDKFKFCPHCGANVNDVKKTNEETNRTNMVMGMMKPPEPMIRGNIKCVDEFISEDPINTTSLNECMHEFVVAEVFTGGTIYVCKKCGATKITTAIPEMDEFIKEAEPFNQNEYILLPVGTTTLTYSKFLELTVKSSGETKEFNNYEEVKIGTESSNDYCIDKPYVSRRQATFLYERYIWFLMDNNSTNGTYINGKRLQPWKKYQLAHKDEISFANQETLIFKKHELDVNILEERSIDSLIGKRIEQYEVLKLIGQGGFFKTYLVMDKKQNKQWAMKVYDKHRQSYSPKLRNIILNEAHMLMRFNYTAIPKVAEIIENNRFICIVREYIFGDSLYTIVSNTGPLEQEIVLKLAQQLCAVLGYLHKQNPPYIYRDMKPENVIVQPCGDIKLVDFGTVSIYDAVQKQRDDCLLMTRGYAAPEQYIGNADPRSDIYSLGVTLHHLITGVSPYEPPYELKPIRSINQNLFPGLEAIILKCVQLNPDERFQNCDELMIALQGGPVYPDKKKGFFKKFKKSFSKKEDGWDSIHRMASKELKKIGNKKCIFKCDCMVDVTNFDAKDPTDSLGYACSANILVFSDGNISVIGDQEAERFHISSVLSYNDNIGNYNPSHEHEVKFILADRAIVIGFYDKDKPAKKELTDKLKQVVLKEKK